MAHPDRPAAGEAKAHQDLMARTAKKDPRALKENQVDQARRANQVNLEWVGKRAEKDTKETQVTKDNVGNGGLLEKMANQVKPGATEQLATRDQRAQKDPKDLEATRGQRVILDLKGPKVHPGPAARTVRPVLMVE